MYSKWIRHFKWLGPLSIVLFLLQYGVTALAEGTFSSSPESKQQKLEMIRASVSSDGKLSDHDQTVVVPEGFSVLIPKGFTYSKPPGTPFSLVAVYDINVAATPAFSVSVMKLDDSLDHLIENMKTILVSRNKTNKFTETKVTDTGRFKLYRIATSSHREGGPVKGGMLFFENGGQAFILTYGTREELFDRNAALFEKIVRSFGPI